MVAPRRPISPRISFSYRVAKRIAQVRRSQGITQESLAAAFGTATKNVQRIESGKQNLGLDTIERLARALDVAPEVFFEERAVQDSSLPPALARLRSAGYDVRLATESGRRSAGAVRVTSLRAAAGQFTRGARAIETIGYVIIPGVAPESRAFVAEVVGDSMKPQIGNGALCLFGGPTLGPREGKIVLLSHRTFDDPELGGPYALKRVGKVSNDRRGRVRVSLVSNNAAFPPIELVLDDPTELIVIAELVRSLLPKRAAK